GMRLAAKRKVGQASRLSGSAGFQPAPAGKMPVLPWANHLSRGYRGWLIRFNGFNAEMLLRAGQLELNFFAHLAIEQRLGEGREIADDALVRLGIPCAQYCKCLRVLGAQLGHFNARSDSDGLGGRGGKVGSARAHEL